MKKLYLTLFLNFLIGTLAFSQSSLGVKYGITLSQVIFNDVDLSFDSKINQKQVLGNTFGISYCYFAERHAGLHFEINHIQKGWEQVIDNNTKFKTTLTYIEIPVMAHISIGKGILRPTLLIGPYAAYLIKSTSDVLTNDQMSQVKFQYDADKDNKIAYGLTGGLGLTLDTGLGTFQTDVRFSKGLSNIINKQSDDEPGFSHNQVIEISLAYFLELNQ